MVVRCAYCGEESQEVLRSLHMYVHEQILYVHVGYVRNCNPLQRTVSLPYISSLGCPLYDSEV